ncbi:MAG: site-2 protease family protein [Cyanobacteria bacterium SID2]|nr:site-2 protease family protein [Cyanobacteria bacterium SID2]MBP0005874.1 site-2 protease family protein [Cyanobacteria bacterium SBC]
MTFLLLLLLGLLTYTILQHSVARITRTPIWLLWLVMMTPALFLSVWAAVAGDDGSVPAIVAVGVFVTCFVLYLWLLYLGRPTTSKTPVDRSSEVAGSVKTPPSPGNLISKLRPIAPSEESQLRNCFNWSVFVLQNLEYRPQAVICRGKLRTNPERAYQTIRQNVERQFGDRFLVVLQEGPNDRPLFVLAPNPQSKASPKSHTSSQNIWLAWGLFVITLFTTTVAGAEFVGLTAEQLQSEPGGLLRGLPYALSLLAILGFHESGHYFAARWHKIRTTLPYFIPIPFFLGTLGAFVQLRSPMPNRKVLFDISVAGPIVGFLVTLPMLWWGLAHSEVVPASDQSGLLNFNELQPAVSLLLSLVCQFTLDGALDPQKAIDLHPVAISGYLGLILTAFNLMPIGQLDGGHMVHSMFGRRTALSIGQVTRFLMLMLALIHRELLLWALLLFFMPLRDEPALNDVTELDNKRDFLGLLCLALLAAVLLPAPRMLLASLG